MASWIQHLKRFFPFKRKNTKSMDLIDTSVHEEFLPWWGAFSIEEEQSHFFKIGDIVLCLDRYNHEWRITCYRNMDSLPDAPIPKHQKPFRTIAAQASNEILLTPILPNRSLLSHLEQPFYIPHGASMLLYVSSPIEIRIEAGKPPIILDEIPTERLSDTWFGKNTLEGELCYASQTVCTPRLDELPRDVTRVISPVRIINRSKETLIVKELRVPLPFLSIYRDKQNHLWTEQLNIYPEAHEHPETMVVKGPPKILNDLQLLSKARIDIKTGLKGLFNPFIWK